MTIEERTDLSDAWLPSVSTVSNRGKPLAPTTRRRYADTIAKGYIGRNPADPQIVNRPHGRPRDLLVIEPEFARQILATVRGVEPWDAAVHLALGL